MEKDPVSVRALTQATSQGNLFDQARPWRNASHHASHVLQDATWKPPESFIRTLGWFWLSRQEMTRARKTLKMHGTQIHRVLSQCSELREDYSPSKAHVTSHIIAQSSWSPWINRWGTPPSTGCSLTKWCFWRHALWSICRTLPQGREAIS